MELTLNSLLRSQRVALANQVTGTELSRAADAHHHAHRGLSYCEKMKDQNEEIIILLL